MQPQNYLLGNVPDPGAAFNAGLQNGQAQQIMQAQQAMVMQQQQAAMVAQQRRDAALQAVLSSPRPTASQYAALMAADPKSSEGYKRAWEVQGKEQSDSRLSDLAQWTAAITNGRPDVAAASMVSQADLMDRTAGAATDEGRALRAQAETVKANPDLALKMFLNPLLLSHPDGKRVFDNIQTQNTEARTATAFPAELRKKEADATTAEVGAKYAERNTLADLETKGWNIKAIQNDIEYKKQANRIAAMNAATSRMNSDTQRQELALKIKEAQGKLDDKLREKVATAESGAANIDNMLNTIERIKKNPGLNDVLGSIEGRLPSVLSDTGADAIALIDTLGSQAFLSQIPSIKGMGALSNAEGEKLQAALTNLSRTQSEGQFRANLDEASRLLNKGRVNLSRATGVPLAKPDTPAAPGARPPLDSFFK